MHYTPYVLFFTLFGFSQENTLKMYIDTVQAEVYSEVSINVYSDNFYELVSFQGTITYDSNSLLYVSNYSSNLYINFGENQIDQGILTYSWYDSSLEGVTLIDSTSLFELNFIIIENSTNSIEINFFNSPTLLEAIDNNFNYLNPTYINGLITFYNNMHNNSYYNSKIIFPTIITKNQDILIDDSANIQVYNIKGIKTKCYIKKLNKLRFLEKGFFIVSLNQQIFKCIVL